MSTLDWIKLVGTVGWESYLWPSVAIQLLRIFHQTPPAVLRTLRAELKPFSLGLALAYSVPPVFESHSAWSYATVGVSIFNWYLIRNVRDEDDDDRWRRRKQKLADKVAELGGKLQVVPAGAS